MNKTSLILSMLFLAGSLVAGTDQKFPPRAQKSQSRCCLDRADTSDARKSAARTTYTGSHIARRLQVNGQITDGPSQLIIIDSTATPMKARGLMIEQGVRSEENQFSCAIRRMREGD